MQAFTYTSVGLLLQLWFSAPSDSGGGQSDLGRTLKMETRPSARKKPRAEAVIKRLSEIASKPSRPLSWPDVPLFLQLTETMIIVPKAGLEPARVSPPPPQDGVSTMFHHFGSEKHYRRAKWLWQQSNSGAGRKIMNPVLGGTISRATRISILA